MAEYIKREAVFKQFDNGEADVVEIYPDGSVDYGFGASNIRDLVNSIPAADVAPVVHGRWEHGYYCYEPATQCSVCKVCLAKGHRAEKQFTYCPNCGAKMDGGADHEAD